MQHRKLTQLTRHTAAKKALLPLRVAVAAFAAGWVVYPLLWIVDRGLGAVGDSAVECLSLAVSLLLSLFLSLFLSLSPPSFQSAAHSSHIAFHPPALVFHPCVCCVAPCVCVLRVRARGCARAWAWAWIWVGAGVGV